MAASAWQQKINGEIMKEKRQRENIGISGSESGESESENESVWRNSGESAISQRKAVMAWQ